ACNDGKELAPVPGHDGVTKSAASERALRRAFDGAPPVIPHAAFGPCGSCHSDSGMAVEGVGFSPPSPHARTKGMSAVSRCQQCHVFQTTRAVFADNGFDGLRQDLRRGRRLNALAPPVIPHQILMRENCQPATRDRRRARRSARPTPSGRAAVSAMSSSGRRRSSQDPAEPSFSTPSRAHHFPLAPRPPDRPPPKDADLRPADALAGDRPLVGALVVR
ncbi:MAG TPA: hypothetical protein VGG06_09225, partial [Thermoanaerobaculia bacterium]